jgi:hypothetical protein
MASPDSYVPKPGDVPPPRPEARTSAAEGQGPKQNRRVTRNGRSASARSPRLPPIAILYSYPRDLRFSIDAREGTLEPNIRIVTERKLVSVEVDNERLPPWVTCEEVETGALWRFHFKRPSVLQVPFELSAAEDKKARDRISISVVDSSGQSVGTPLSRAIYIYEDKPAGYLVFLLRRAGEVRNPWLSWAVRIALLVLGLGGWLLWNDRQHLEQNAAIFMGWKHLNFLENRQAERFASQDQWYPSSPEGVKFESKNEDLTVNFVSGGFALLRLRPSKKTWNPDSVLLDPFETTFTINFPPQKSESRAGWLIYAPTHSRWFSQAKPKGVYVKLQRAYRVKSVDAAEQTILQLTSSFCADSVSDPDTCETNGDQPGPISVDQANVTEIFVTATVQNQRLKISLSPTIPDGGSDVDPSKLGAVFSAHDLDLPVGGTVAFLSFTGNSYSVSEVVVQKPVAHDKPNAASR